MKKLEQAIAEDEERNKFFGELAKEWRGGNHVDDELKERARIEQAIRDLQLYIDVKWGGRNDMFNLALAALREKAERKLKDTITKALRRHIKTLQKRNNSWQKRYYKLQAENEQLQAQVARMREALRKAREAIKAAWSDGSANAAMDKASEALAEIDKAIGGKEDV